MYSTSSETHVRASASAINIGDAFVSISQDEAESRDALEHCISRAVHLPKQKGGLPCVALAGIVRTTEPES